MFEVNETVVIGGHEGADGPPRMGRGRVLGAMTVTRVGGVRLLYLVELDVPAAVASDEQGRPGVVSVLACDESVLRRWFGEPLTERHVSQGDYISAPGGRS